MPPLYTRTAPDRWSGSSGQRGRGLKSSASVRPSRSRSMPAQAIMAPLSVQSFTGGATRRAPCRRGNLFEAAAQIEVGRDAARDDERGRWRRRERVGASVGQDIAHGALERGAEIGDRALVVGIELLDGLAHRRLEAGEGEVAAGLAPHRPRQGEALRIAAGRRALDGRAAGKAQAQKLRRLVEAFAGRIVDRRAQPREVARPAHGQELAMAARDQQQQIGKGHVLGQPHRQRMAFEMIDGEEGLVVGEGQRLGRHHAHHHAADQAGPAGGGDAVELRRDRGRRSPAPPRPARRSARDGRARRFPARRRRSGDARSTGCRPHWPGSGRATSRRAAVPAPRRWRRPFRRSSFRFPSRACVSSSVGRPPTLEQRHGGSPPETRHARQQARFGPGRPGARRPGRRGAGAGGARRHRDRRRSRPRAMSSRTGRCPRPAARACSSRRSRRRCSRAASTSRCTA